MQFPIAISRIYCCIIAEIEPGAYFVLGLESFRVFRGGGGRGSRERIDGFWLERHLVNGHKRRAGSSVRDTEMNESN